MSRVCFLFCLFVFGFCKPPELKNTCDPNAFSLEDKLVSDLILQSNPDTKTEVLQFLFPDTIINCLSNPNNRGPFTLSGTVRGLTEQDITVFSGTDPNESILVKAGDTSFSFPATFPGGRAYEISVSNHSTGFCYVVNGQGVVQGNVTSVSIVCVEPLGMVGLASWYKADSLSLADGAFVNTLQDQTSNGNTLTGGGVTFSATGLNGKPAIELNGGSLSTAAASGLGGSSFSIYLVFKRTNPPFPIEEYVFFLGNDNGGCPNGSIVLSVQSGGPGELGVQTPCFPYLVNPGPGFAIPDGDVTSKALSIRYNYSVGNSFRSVQMNGVQYFNGFASDIVYSTSNIYFQFGDYPNAGRPFRGAIAEYLYFNRALSALEDQTINCYLAKKYNFAHGASCQ